MHDCILLTCFDHVQGSHPLSHQADTVILHVEYHQIRELIPQLICCFVMSSSESAHHVYVSISPSSCMSLGSEYKVTNAGEVPWVMRTIKAYHSEAVRKNVKIVHFCGFDSIPSDLGTALIVDHMQSKLHRYNTHLFPLSHHCLHCSMATTLCLFLALHCFQAHHVQHLLCTDVW